MNSRGPNERFVSFSSKVNSSCNVRESCCLLSGDRDQAGTWGAFQRRKKAPNGKKSSRNGNTGG